ncbi:MAG: translation initiation factor IF-2 subunit alpha [Candidatus Methanomethylophilus sp.]|nr:translation initiation factor IF-2 subunit alpha [Methanomethylophilus sp.]MDD3232930.1 translation initiation factor IF-2 subunit alpha [Methanomethylophilus sp.]MDD4221555.1 translation initiation factor IF-2 subunit alpha [Methanomethylophilus sp.]MDD4668545.1 translation initiation factor IF-2 subunit alpha [Methanomethylophilus sp.]
MSRARGFPENGELVVCTVSSVKNFGAFVTLDEYENKEGFVHVRDVATGWVKYIRDYIREGQKIVCKVLGVDSQKGHIDLSLKAVNDHQKREKIQQWKNEKKAEKLLELVAQKLSVSADDAFEMFGRQLYDDYGSLYDAFEAVVTSPEDFRADYTGNWVDAFVQVATDNINPPAVEIDGVLEMTSAVSDGVEHIKKALLAGLAAADGADAVITSVGSPRYRVVIKASQYKEAEEIMKEVSTAAIDSLTADGGSAVLKRESK